MNKNEKNTNANYTTKSAPTNEAKVVKLDIQKKNKIIEQNDEKPNNGIQASFGKPAMGSKKKKIK